LAVQLRAIGLAISCGTTTTFWKFLADLASGNYPLARTKTKPAFQRVGEVAKRCENRSPTLEPFVTSRLTTDQLRNDLQTWLKVASERGLVLKDNFDNVVIG
jgi:hypothetical protein